MNIRPEESFIKILSECNSNEYIHCNNDLYTKLSSKPSSYKTKEIALNSLKCLEHFSSKDTGSLQERLQNLTSLQNSLLKTSDRIKNSIMKRWWYPIMHFFGYQAKTPKYFQDALNALNRAVLTLYYKEQADELTEKANKIREEVEKKEKEEEEKKEKLEQQRQKEEEDQRQRLQREKLEQQRKAEEIRIKEKEEQKKLESELKTLEEPLCLDPDEMQNLSLESFENLQRELKKRNGPYRTAALAQVSFILMDYLTQCPLENFTWSKYLSVLEVNLDHVKTLNVNNEKISCLSNSLLILNHKMMNQADKTIGWNGIPEKLENKIVTFFLDKASEKDRIKFLEEIVLKKNSDTYQQELVYPSYAYALINIEDATRREILLSYGELILHLLAKMTYEINSKKEIEWIYALYKKWPNAEFWQGVLNTRYSSDIYWPLKASVIGCLILNKLLDLPFDTEKSEKLITEVRSLLKLVPDYRLGWGLKKVADFLVTYAEKLDDSKIRAFFCAFTKDYLRDYFEPFLTSDNDPFVEMSINEFITYNSYDPLEVFSYIDFVRKIQNIKQAEIFIKRIKQLPEPTQWIHLRFFVKKWRPYGDSEPELLFIKNPEYNIEPLLKNSGLELKHYILETKFDFLKIVRELQNNFFNPVQEISTEEEFKNFIKKILGKHLLLQAIVGGVELPNGIIIKPKLDQKTIQNVFTNHGLTYDFFNKKWALIEFLTTYLEEKEAKKRNK